MPSRKPRVNLTIEPDTKAALGRLSDVSGVAATSWANQILNDAVPVMRALTEAFTVAKNHPERTAQVMGDLAQSVMVQTAQASLELEKHRPKARMRKAGTGKVQKGGK